MENEESSNYSLVEALVSPNTVALNIAEKYNRITGKISKIQDKYHFRATWIRFMMAILRKRRKISGNIANKELSISILGDAIHDLWKAMSNKALYISRIYTLRQFKKQLDELIIHRRHNIRKQWKVFSHELIQMNYSVDLRNRWFEFADFLNYMQIKKAHERYAALSFHTEEEIRQKWKHLAGFMVARLRIADTKKRERAIFVITKFVRRIIQPFREQKTADSVTQFIWMPELFVEPLLNDELDIIRRNVRRWIIRQCHSFSVAYADETLKTAYVHVIADMLIDDTKNNGNKHQKIRNSKKKTKY